MLFRSIRLCGPISGGFFDCKDFKSGCHPSAKISVFSESRKRESFVLHDEPDPWNNRRMHVVPRCAVVCTDRKSVV